MTDERWKQIDEFPTYWISNLGKIINLKRKRLVRHSWNGTNYYVSFTNRKGVEPRRGSRGVNTLMKKYFPNTREILFDPGEGFRKIKEYPRYLVNNQGTVYDGNKGQELSTLENPSQYVILFDKGVSYMQEVDKLVHDAFKDDIRVSGIE